MCFVTVFVYVFVSEFVYVFVSVFVYVFVSVFVYVFVSEFVFVCVWKERFCKRKDLVLLPVINFMFMQKINRNFKR